MKKPKKVTPHQEKLLFRMVNPKTGKSGKPAQHSRGSIWNFLVSLDDQPIRVKLAQTSRDMS